MCIDSRQTLLREQKQGCILKEMVLRRKFSSYQPREDSLHDGGHGLGDPLSWCVGDSHGVCLLFPSIIIDGSSFLCINYIFTSVMRWGELEGTRWGWGECCRWTIWEVDEATSLSGHWLFICRWVFEPVKVCSFNSYSAYMPTTRTLRWNIPKGWFVGRSQSLSTVQLIPLNSSWTPVLDWI